MEHKDERHGQMQMRGVRKGYSGYFILNSYLKMISLDKNPSDRPAVRAWAIKKIPKGDYDEFGGK